MLVVHMSLPNPSAKIHYYKIILVAKDPWDREKIILLLEILDIMITQSELKKYLDPLLETVITTTKH